MKILHLDTNHPLLIGDLNKSGFENHEDFTSDKTTVEGKIGDYDGIVVRSRFPIDKSFLDKAENLKFIGRVGAGLENIDVKFAREKGIKLFAVPEGNRNAVAEHCLGMLLSLFNKLNKADREIRTGVWDREGNRGIELDGKTVGIIGFGNTGKAFAKKLRGFDCEVLCCDIVEKLGNGDARQTSLEELREKCDVLSLHVPQNVQTLNMVGSAFTEKFKKPFWLLNTSRGKIVNTEDLVSALKSGKVLGAGLDVLEYEKDSFENLFTSKSPARQNHSGGEMPPAFQYLIEAKNVLLSPHVAGWTVESKEKLARMLVQKIISGVNT